MGIFKNHKSHGEYAAASKWINYMYPDLHTHILNLGVPEYRGNIPTAAVEHHGEGIVASSKSHYFNFIINPDFEKKLDRDDYAFILAHETFHILLGHLAVMRNYDNLQKFNIATDCIINDWLYGYGIEPSQTGNLEPLYGQNIVGFDTSHSSLDEIYRLIPDDMVSQDGKCTGNCQGSPDSSGEAGSGTCTCPTTVDDHNSMFGDSSAGDGGQASAQDVEKAIKDFVDGGGFDSLPPMVKDFIHDNNDIVKEMKKDDRPTGGWSPTGFGMSIEEQLADGVSLKWAELMNEITPDLYNAGSFSTAKKRTFTRPSKKLVTIYPKAILPSDYFEAGGVGNRHEKDNNTFVLALDHSGSVSATDKRMFTALAHSIPETRAKVFGCTFSTMYVPYDIHGGPGQRTANGGTDFGAVEQYIQEHVVPELGKYPKAVVVITDGMATFGRWSPTDEQLAKNWYWLLSGNRTQTSCSKVNAGSKDHLYRLSDFAS